MRPKRFLPEDELLDTPKLRGFVSVIPRMKELPMYESDGAPAGVNEAAEDGGGPAGVVEGLSARNEKPVPRPLLSGVDGAGLAGGLESGTMKRDAIMARQHSSAFEFS